MPNPFIVVAKLLLPFLHKILVSIWYHPIGRTAAIEGATRAIARGYSSLRGAQPPSTTPSKLLSATIKEDLKRAQTKGVTEAQSQPHSLLQRFRQRWRQRGRRPTVEQLALRSRVRWRLLTLATFVQLGVLWYFPIKDPWDVYKDEPYEPDPSLFGDFDVESPKPQTQSAWLPGLSQWIGGLSSWTPELLPWVQGLSPRVHSLSPWVQGLTWPQHWNPLENGWVSCSDALKADKLVLKGGDTTREWESWREARRKKVDQMRRIWREQLQVC